MLKFTRGNAKLSKDIWIFNLPAGYSCPGAKECLSKATINGIKDGPHTKFRCYAASGEAQYPNVYNAHWHNFSLLKTCISIDEISSLIESSLPKTSIIRLHSSGDMYSKNYFRAWVEVAKNHPNILIYGYTKSIPYWLQYRKLMPANMILTASMGGKWDGLAKKSRLKRCEVVFSLEEARRKKLPVDHDDSCAMEQEPKRFGLILHNVQPKGTPAATAWQKLKVAGYGYSKNKNKISLL